MRKTMGLQIHPHLESLDFTNLTPSIPQNLILPFNIFVTKKLIAFIGTPIPLSSTVSSVNTSSHHTTPHPFPSNTHHHTTQQEQLKHHKHRTEPPKQTTTTTATRSHARSTNTPTREPISTVRWNKTQNSQLLRHMGIHELWFLAFKNRNTIIQQGRRSG